MAEAKGGGTFQGLTVSGPTPRGQGIASPSGVEMPRVWFSARTV